MCGCFGANFGANFDLCSVVVAPPTKSISHVTIDAGVDIRKKSRARQVQILTLTVEIPCVGTSFTKNVLTLKAKGTTKIKDSLSYKAKGTTKISQLNPVKTKGTAFSNQKTLVSAVGIKSQEMYGMKIKIKKMRLLDTLKEALHSLDEE